MSKANNPSTESTIPTVSEDNNSLGDIRINHSVVANIVRLAALEVSGVVAVGGSFVDGIAEIFSKKGGDERGVRVARVNVIIDGVRTQEEEEKSSDDWENHPHTD